MNRPFRKRKQTHTVEIQNDKIIFTLMLDGIQEYLTYDPVLYEILKMERLKPFRNEGRLRISVRESGVDFKFYIYDLARACYDSKVKAESFVKDMQEFYDYKSREDLDIDHLDKNVHNNTKGNIALMDSGLNRSKSAITAHFKPPFYLNSVYHNGEYRIQLMNIADNEYIEGLLRGIGFDCKIDGRVQTGMHFRCSSAEDYVDCLYYLAETHYSWCQPDTTPKQHHTANKETPCWTSGIRNSLHAQKILSLMDDSEFDVYVRRDNKKMNIA